MKLRLLELYTKCITLQQILFIFALLWKDCNKETVNNKVILYHNNSIYKFSHTDHWVYEIDKNISKFTLSLNIFWGYIIYIYIYTHTNLKHDAYIKYDCYY